MALIAVSAHDIDTHGLHVERELPIAWLDAELEDARVGAVGPGHVDVRLSRSDKDVIVRGRVVAKVVTPCARCLDPASIDVDAELSLLLTPTPEKPREGSKKKLAVAGANGAAHAKKKAQIEEEPEHEFSAEEAEHDTFDGETVVLDPFVREAILLELPNFPLCSEACPGIRPAAPPDQAEPIDPRLAPLRALKARLAAIDAKGPAPKATPKKKPKE